MNTKEALKLAGGSVLVYCVVAACGSVARSGFSPGSDGGGGGILDALTDPVGEAQAAPNVATENCDKTFTVSGTTQYYAEHAYPGKAVSDLATLVAITHLTTPPPEWLPGYADIIYGGVYLRDGYGAISCPAGSLADAQNMTVTFVLP